MDNKIIILVVLFILLSASIVFMPKYAGLLLMFSLILFGMLALVWKEGNVRLACLGILVLLSIINISANGMKFGIDFIGGTRIPVILERSVDEVVMEQLVSTIKTRASVLGLTEVKVKAIGDSEIRVEVPSADDEQVSFIESVLSHQGVYLAVVDGKAALLGEDIYPYSIHQLTSVQELRGNDWGVGFSITQKAAEKFAEVVKGKPKYPLYMFLDREEDAVIFLTKEELKKEAPEDATMIELTDALEDVLRLEGSITTYYILDWDGNQTLPNSTNNENITAIINKGTAVELKTNLTNMGFLLKERDEQDITPKIRKLENGKLVVSEWKAVGMLDSPVLSPDITTGKVNRDYTIGGGIPAASASEKQKIAKENTKRIESILKGGSLPVGISLGSSTRIPASLGNDFLKLSMLGVGGALVAVAIFVGIRYRHLRVIVAILAVSISEFIILSAILGSFTIDLAGVAGIIAAIGVGVDAQIVITDELLKKGISLHEKLTHAFDIIKMNVIVAIVAMAPLLFSGLVEIIGFAIASVLGTLLGFLLSRPAYSVLAERIIEEDTENEEKK